MHKDTKRVFVLVQSDPSMCIQAVSLGSRKTKHAAQRESGAQNAAMFCWQQQCTKHAGVRFVREQRKGTRAPPTACAFYPFRPVRVKHAAHARMCRHMVVHGGARSAAMFRWQAKRMHATVCSTHAVNTRTSTAFRLRAANCAAGARKRQQLTRTCTSADVSECCSCTATGTQLRCHTHRPSPPGDAFPVPLYVFEQKQLLILTVRGKIKKIFLDAKWRYMACIGIGCSCYER